MQHDEQAAAPVESGAPTQPQPPHDADELVSRLDLIEERPLDQRSAAYLALAEELERMLASADQASADRPSADQPSGGAR